MGTVHARNGCRLSFIAVALCLAAAPARAAQPARQQEAAAASADRLPPPSGADLGDRLDDGLRLAADDGAADKKKKKRKKVESDEAGGEDAKAGAKSNSTAVRSRKHFAVGAGAGEIIGSIPGYELSGAYLFGSSLQVEAAYMAGKSTLPTSEDDASKISNFTISGSLLLVRARYFIGNSFNATLALGERQIQANATIDSKTTADSASLTLNLTSIVAGLTVGNHWAWDSGFFLGCDWVGYFVPLSSTTSTTFTTTGPNATGTSDALAQSVQDSGNSLGKTPSSQLLVLTLGWMF